MLLLLPMLSMLLLPMLLLFLLLLPLPLPLPLLVLLLLLLSLMECTVAAVHTSYMGCAACLVGWSRSTRHYMPLTQASAI